MTITTITHTINKINKRQHSTTWIPIFLLLLASIAVATVPCSIADICVGNDSSGVRQKKKKKRKSTKTWGLTAIVP